MISIKNLNKFFNRGGQNEIHVINDVTLDLPERGMTAIFGKSGCGKTTLLNVIGGLDGFASGSLTIEGQSVTKNTDEIRNKYVGYIFQNYNLSNSESCYDNVASALRLCGMRDEEEISRRVMAALKNVGMEKYSARTPDTLSGGQQQRIAIARAIVKNPPVILADEPTGNLDEANTVMIMDLLREIARDHLVLLVTHEQSLVDAYCNRIIELSDGKIISTREGRAEGVSKRSKQDIYLGELDRREISCDNVNIEYYGEDTERPLDLKIVNKDGRIYLSLGDERVHIIDGTGEVRLVEGVYQESEAHEEKPFDMTALPSFEGSRYGSLFTLRSSLKSAYRQQMANRKRGKKALRAVLLLFATVTVIMSAVFGSSLGRVIDADNSYNHNTFYVYTEEGDSEIFEAALTDPGSGIDHYTVYPYFPSGDRTLNFRLASFETFSQSGYLTSLESHAVILDSRVADQLPLLAGDRELPSREYMLISDRVADDIIETAGLGYVNDYSDLIGMTCNHYSFGGRPLRVGGVVSSGEHTVYLSEMAAAYFVNQGAGYIRVQPASDYGISVKDGEVVVTISDVSMNNRAPEVGSKVDVQGQSLTVDRVIANLGGYMDWIKGKKLSREEYFASTLPEGADLGEYTNEHYFEYDEYYYDQIDSYIREMYILNTYSFDLWLYCVKNITEARELHVSADLCAAEHFKAEKGRYPTKAEFDALEELYLPSWDNLRKYEELYRREFEATYRNSVYLTTALVSDADYVKISKSYGNTDPIFRNAEEGFVYTQIHSSNPTLTEAFLNERFADREIEYYESVITPDMVLAMVISAELESVVGYLIALLVILAIMSVCMYFIMRSSLMNRIREIGIYRAIGVSKRNILLRFGVEASLVSAGTVLVGYLMSGIFIRILEHISPNAETIFYYPTWYSLLVMVVLLGETILCGILPVISLLRKTPSEILAKYDV